MRTTRRGRRRRQRRYHNAAVKQKLANEKKHQLKLQETPDVRHAAR
jgi:hypothetical protein